MRVPSFDDLGKETKGAFRLVTICACF